MFDWLDLLIEELASLPADLPLDLLDPDYIDLGAGILDAGGLADALPMADAIAESIPAYSNGITFSLGDVPGLTVEELMAQPIGQPYSLGVPGIDGQALAPNYFTFGADGSVTSLGQSPIPGGFPGFSSALTGIDAPAWQTGSSPASQSGGGSKGGGAGQPMAGGRPMGAMPSAIGMGQGPSAGGVPGGGSITSGLGSLPAAGRPIAFSSAQAPRAPALDMKLAVPKAIVPPLELSTFQPMAMNLAPPSSGGDDSMAMLLRLLSGGR